jgi:uncharacterized protein (TIGR00369 family)
MTPAAARPFYRHLGIEILETGPGRVQVRMAANPNLLNARGDVHGGAIAGLIDAALSNAARAVLPPGSSTATIQFTSHYLEAGRGTLLAEGHAVRAGGTVVTAEVYVRDEAGQLVAQALGTLRVLRPR